ncbi:hypothetical protein CA264_09000 [Pontibacter actiniarum]|uniref:Uncharacterized protein n=1 Tax=Pontibacter actiniarum TaxID=323450 RepID=A0A1X9YRU9_9BACT|nr:hypothetical protein CA264_09000 [Pontibacter actiniarum]
MHWATATEVQLQLAAAVGGISGGGSRRSAVKAAGKCTGFSESSTHKTKTNLSDFTTKAQKTELFKVNLRKAVQEGVEQQNRCYYP